MTIVQRTTSRQNDVDPINNSFKKSWGMGGGGGWEIQGDGGTR